MYLFWNVKKKKKKSHRQSNMKKLDVGQLQTPGQRWRDFEPFQGMRRVLDYGLQWWWAPN